MLTPYEIGSVLTKHANLTHALTTSEAEDTRRVLNRMLLTMTLHPSGKIKQETLKIAAETRLSYHDASCICAARELEAELFTEDKRLAEVATRRGVSGGPTTRP